MRPMKRSNVFVCMGIVVLIISIFLILHMVKNSVVPGIPCEGSDSFSYNGRRYSSEEIYIADDDKVYMGVTKERRSSVYFIGDKDNPDIVEVCGSDNTRIYKAADYDIKVSGQITKVLINPAIRGTSNVTLQKRADFDMLNRLMSVKGNEDTYEVNNFYTEGNVFYLEFDGCPAAVAENKGGYIAKVGETWIYVSPENMKGIESIGDSNEARICGIEVTDDELIQWIETSEISNHIE